MDYADLGHLTVSKVGLGCNNLGGRLDIAAAREVVDAAIDVGITFFDTADIYGNRSGSAVYGNHGGSERVLGELLRGRREQVVLATKFGGEMGEGLGGGAPGYVARAVDASLSRLQTDRIDLLYYHWPDRVTPISDTVGAMAELIAAGKVGAIGISNVTVDELRAADAVAPIAAVQNEYSLLARQVEAELLPACAELGVGFVPYYPLAAGLLTGKYLPGRPPPPGARLSDDGPLTDGFEATPLVSAQFERIERLRRFAAERGRSLLELAIAGLASHPAVRSVIAGATSAEQVRANARAGGWQLTAGELERLAAI